MDSAIGMQAANGSRILWGKVALGCLIGAQSLGATAIDVVNNHAYGAAISPAMAAVMVLAGLGFTAIPGMAAIRGWNVLRAAGTLICFITTAYCAVNAYAARQAAQILAAENASRVYADARQAVETARGEAAAARNAAGSITELMPVAELQRLYDEADARAKAEASDPKRGARCGDACRKAEAERDAYSPRIAAARAKEAALARAEKAETRLAEARSQAQTGDAEPNMIASAIAARYALDAHDVARAIALIMAMLGIAVTLICAGFMHDAMSLIAEGLLGEGTGNGREPRAVQPMDAAHDMETEAQPMDTEPTAEADEPENIQPVETPAQERGAAEELMGQFILECLRINVAGAEMLSGQLFRAFDIWWSYNAKGVPLPSQMRLARALKAAGITSAKRGGRMRYIGVALAD